MDALGPGGTVLLSPAHEPVAPAVQPAGDAGDTTADASGRYSPFAASAVGSASVAITGEPQNASAALLQKDTSASTRSSRREAKDEQQVDFWIIDEKTKVSDSSAIGGPCISTLLPGTRVQVLEQVNVWPRLRGRIAEPPGWITLRNEQTLQIFAHQESDGNGYQASPMAESVVATPAAMGASHASSRNKLGETCASYEDDFEAFEDGDPQDDDPEESSASES